MKNRPFSMEQGTGEFDMKKIVHVVEAFASGIFTFLTELCNSTSDIYDITIIYSVRRETPENFERYFNKNVNFVKVDMCRGMDPFKNTKSLIGLYKTLKGLEPDLVHLHSSKAGFLGRTACFMLGCDMTRVFYNPHGYSFLQSNESKIKRRLYYLLEQAAAAMGGYTVGCSRDEYLQALRISSRVFNINNGIDCEELQAITVKHVKIDAGIKIGTLGRICCQKNPDMFNEIAGELLQYDFIWIGDGELKNKLKSPNIRITGWLERAAALQELKALDIFILTSLWEGLPISLLEAMYMGKPVVVSNIEGCRDAAQHHGFIANNPMEYVQSINYIAEKGMYYFESNKNYISQQFNKNIMVQEYISLYEKN